MMRIIDGKKVKIWSDNDGGYWYRDPETGRAVVVRE